MSEAAVINLDDYRLDDLPTLGDWDRVADRIDVKPLEQVDPNIDAHRAAEVEGALVDIYGPDWWEERSANARAYFRDAARRYDSRSTLNPHHGNVGIYKGETIEFVEGAWAAYSRVWVEALARDDNHPRHTRLLFAAMGRVEPRSGLAYFQDGELREILGAPGRPCTPQAVTKALSRARELGLILAESDSQRVYLDRQHVQRGR